jgi:hypothetical protein
VGRLGTVSGTGRHFASLTALTASASLVVAEVTAAVSGGVASVALTPPSTALMRFTVGARHASAAFGAGGGVGAGGVVGSDGRHSAFCAPTMAL